MGWQNKLVTYPYSISLLQAYNSLSSLTTPNELNESCLNTGQYLKTNNISTEAMSRDHQFKQLPAKSKNYLEI